MLDKLRMSSMSWKRLGCKFDELAKLSCKFDELDKSWMCWIK